MQIKRRDLTSLYQPHSFYEHIEISPGNSNNTGMQLTKIKLLHYLYMKQDQGNR